MGKFTKVFGVWSCNWLRWKSTAQGGRFALAMSELRESGLNGSRVLNQPQSTKSPPEPKYIPQPLANQHERWRCFVLLVELPIHDQGGGSRKKLRLTYSEAWGNTFLVAPAGMGMEVCVDKSSEVS